METTSPQDAQKVISELFELLSRHSPDQWELACEYLNKINKGLGGALRAIAFTQAPSEAQHVPNRGMPERVTVLPSGSNPGLVDLLESSKYLASRQALLDFADNYLRLDLRPGNYSRAKLVQKISSRFDLLPSAEQDRILRVVEDLESRVNRDQSSSFFQTWAGVIGRR